MTGRYVVGAETVDILAAQQAAIGQSKLIAPEDLVGTPIGPARSQSTRFEVTEETTLDAAQRVFACEYLQPTQYKHLEIVVAFAGVVVAVSDCRFCQVDVSNAFVQDGFLGV